MGKDHPRFREIYVYQCSPKCPNEEGQLKVVLFYRDENLRSHAVGHFANMTEIHEWKRWQDIDLNAVTKSIDSLREIGCPFLISMPIGLRAGPEKKDAPSFRNVRPW